MLPLTLFSSKTRSKHVSLLAIATAALLSLGSLHVSPGYTDEIIHLFAAVDIVASDREPEGAEEFEAASRAAFIPSDKAQFFFVPTVSRPALVEAFSRQIRADFRGVALLSVLSFVSIQDDPV